MRAIVYSCRGFGATNLNSVLCAAGLRTVWPLIKPFHSPCFSFPMCERRAHESQRLLVAANVMLLLTCSYLRARAFFQKTQGQISHHVIWSSWHLAGNRGGNLGSFLHSFFRPLNALRRQQAEVALCKACQGSRGLSWEALPIPPFVQVPSECLTWRLSVENGALTFPSFPSVLTSPPF